MAALSRMIEACLLCAMGAFMVVLSQSSIYWQFFNPKYSWLTFVSGAIVVIIGFAGLLNIQRQRRISEFIAILTLLFLAGTAVFSFDYMEPDSAGGSLTREYTVEETPRVRLGDTEYVKINSAELVLGETEGIVSAGQTYAVQGAVIRSQELDKAGYIGLGRLYITCCFADSIGVVTLVQVSNPEAYTHGSWGRALGVLEEGVPLPGETIVLSGALTAIRSGKYILRATEVTEQPVEGVPFIFEVREQAPFAY